MNLDVAIATHRGQTVWQNEQWSWQKLSKRLSVTHRTAESYATYISIPKPRQDEIKDVGGFVGGYLLEGKRSKAYVKYRQILTLDVDYGYPELWDDFTMYYRNAALVYSTHKHSIVSPRLRIVLPLDRPVTREEYEAIGRKIAYTIGMRFFDRTTFQAERLMYWPSTAKDGDYYFKSQEGPWVEADKILSEYRDWKNVSEWPLCPTETEVLRSNLKKQEDPREKEGVIGAFCRTYSISQAIETFLSDIYIPCGEDRYTYSGGSTAAGAVCYDDKFLFSHHSTDPISGQLCNSFDLVRIHKFGFNDIDPTLPNSKKPSFTAMNNLARTDAAVIHELGIFKLKTPEGEDTDWLKTMKVVKSGEYESTINTFLLIMQNDPGLKNRFWLNEFDYRVYVKGGVPWSPPPKMREITDRDEAGLRHYIEQKYGVYHAAKIKDAYELVCKENSFHPIKEYLEGLTWDGEKRLDTLFIDQLGVPDTPYTRAVTRKSLTAAVARIMRPGIKYDYMVVTLGPQGRGKSSLLYDLGKDWFSDTLDSVTGKDAYIQIQGVWLLEMGELSAVKKAELEAVKTFITKREDRFRPPFGKHTVALKRQMVPFGTTNDWSFLKDPTGNRRFWPLVVNKKYIPGTIDADAIWAEAVWRYNKGEELYLSEELEAMAEEQQRAHTEQDERAGRIGAYLDMLFPPNWDDMTLFERIQYIGSYEEHDAAPGSARKDKVCAAEIWCELFKENIANMSAYGTKFIHNIMNSLPEWERGETMRFKKYGNQRSYVRVGSEVAPEELKEEWEREI